MSDDGTLIDPKLLEIMQCPACAGDAVREGIPVMLIEEAVSPQDSAGS